MFDFPYTTDGLKNYERMKAEIEWINQKERKPVCGTHVLVTDQKDLWIGECTMRAGIIQWALVFDGAPPFLSEDVTHWAYYPKLP
jgi:hypothetical protein